MKNLIKEAIRSFGFELKKVKSSKSNIPALTRNDFLTLYFSNHSQKDFFFVQIGASDGKHGDPIHNFVHTHKLRGMLVEPQPLIFDQLVKNYEGLDDLIFCNLAVSKTDLPFYTVTQKVLEQVSKEDALRLTGIASFDRKLFRKRLLEVLPKIWKVRVTADNIDSFIAEINVNSISLKSLLSQYKVSKIDLLLLDCQGKDFEILKEFDFTKYKPSLINFEYIHLPEKEVNEALHILQQNGYRYFVWGNDICAYTVQK